MVSGSVLPNTLLATIRTARARESSTPAEPASVWTPAVVDSGAPGAPAMPGTIDEHAFESLYRRTAPALREYAARVLGNRTHADDIVQETYLRLVRSPPGTDDPRQLRAWLFKIASRLIVDHWRRGRRERPVPEQPPDAMVAPGRDPSLHLDMTRVFRTLNAQQRQLMWLAYVEGADHREIAAALGVGEKSVRVLLHRTRHKLAKILRAGGRGPARHRQR
jgi:RNA polymerase sigma-70 factor (ECF subfamily)